jgi:hypothetical protein
LIFVEAQLVQGGEASTRRRELSICASRR